MNDKALRDKLRTSAGLVRVTVVDRQFDPVNTRTEVVSHPSRFELITTFYHHLRSTPFVLNVRRTASKGTVIGEITRSDEDGPVQYPVNAVQDDVETLVKFLTNEVKEWVPVELVHVNDRNKARTESIRANERERDLSFVIGCRYPRCIHNVAVRDLIEHLRSVHNL